MERRFQSPLHSTEECIDITAKSILLDCEGFYYVFSEIEQELRKPDFTDDYAQYQANLEDQFEKRMKFPVTMPETPKIVNGAFAAELALKYLTFKEKKAFECTHDIKKLFFDLPDKDKAELTACLKTEAHQSDETLAFNLHQIANYFEEWRYFFEKTEMGCNGFFDKFVKIVCEYALSFREAEE